MQDVLGFSDWDSFGKDLNESLLRLAKAYEHLTLLSCDVIDSREILQHRGWIGSAMQKIECTYEQYHKQIEIAQTALNIRFQPQKDNPDVN